MSAPRAVSGDRCGRSTGRARAHVERAGRFRAALLGAMVAALATVLPGCMGLGVGSFGTQEGEATNPWPSVDWHGRRTINSWDLPTAVASSQLLDEWGEPDARSLLDGGAELWTYTAGLRWSGVLVIVVIVPLPLALPVGREHVSFVITDGLVTGARSSVTDSGFYCGVAWAPSWFHGGGWHAGCGGRIDAAFSSPFE